MKFITHFKETKFNRFKCKEIQTKCVFKPQWISSYLFYIIPLFNFLCDNDKILNWHFEIFAGDIKYLNDHDYKMYFNGC